MDAPARSSIWLPLALTWTAFVLRVGGLTAQSLWRDEVDSFRFATQALSGLMEMFVKPGENGPLFFLSLRPWLLIAGVSEFALRFPAALAGTLATPLLYALMRRLTGDRTASAISALLLATAPYAVWYGQEAKMYAALTVMAPLSFYLALRASREGRWWRWALLYGVTSLSFYTHLLAALVIPVQAIWLLVLPSLAHELAPAARRQRRWAALIYLALLMLPYLPLLRWLAPPWLAAVQETGYPFTPLPTILLVLVAAFGQGILPITQPLTLLPATLALLAGIGLWARPTPGRLRWATVALLLVWLLLPALGIYAISLRRPLFADRYLIWTLPAFLGLAGLGIAALARAWRPLGAGLFAALLALNLVAVWEQAATPIKSDFRAAARYVAAQRQPSDLLIFQIPYNRYTFDYYAGLTTSWLDGPFTNNGMSEAELDAVLAQGTAGTRGVWLIVSETAMWDERNLTESWLSRHGAITAQAEFARVTVTRYALD